MTRREKRAPAPIEVARSEAKERLRKMELPRLALPLAPGGVTDSDVAILRELAESRSGPMTAGELAEATGYSERTVYRRVRGLKMNEEVREGGLLSEAEEGGVWFKSVEIAEQVGEYFAMQDARSED